MTRTIKLVNRLGVEITPAIEAAIGYAAFWSSASGGYPFLTIYIVGNHTIQACYYREQKSLDQHMRPDFFMEGVLEHDGQRFGFHS